MKTTTERKVYGQHLLLDSETHDQNGGEGTKRLPWRALDYLSLLEVKKCRGTKTRTVLISLGDLIPGRDVH